MLNIWSEKRWVNVTIDILLFLLGINFLHYAQIIVPIICLIMFIDNNFKFKVKNIKVFVLLCLFGVSFLAFGFKLGAFAFMGLFVPMAYYVGSNMYEPSEEKIIHVIYIFTIAMTLHIVLNFATDLAIRGLNTFNKLSHFDIWTLDEYPTTQTAACYVFVLGILYYVFVYEKNKKNMFTTIGLFAIALPYLLVLGRRTPLLIFAIVVLFTFVVDFFILKNRNKGIIVVLSLLLFAIAFGILLYMTYEFNLFGLRAVVEKMSIVRKFIYQKLIYTTRFDIMKDTIELMPMHMWGGREITNILTDGPHELWLDVFDIGGIVPYIILIIYSIISAVCIIKIFLNSKLTKSFKLLIMSLFISITLQFFLEPIMSGSSVILLCVVIILGSLECLQAK